MGFSLQGDDTPKGIKTPKDVEMKASKARGVYVVNYHHISRVGDETFRQSYFWQKEDAIRAMRNEWTQKKYAFNWPDLCDVEADEYEYYDKSFTISVTEANIRFEKSSYKWDVQFCDVH